MNGTAGLRRFSGVADGDSHQGVVAIRQGAGVPVDGPWRGCHRPHGQGSGGAFRQQLHLRNSAGVDSARLHRHSSPQDGLVGRGHKRDRWHRQHQSDPDSRAERPSAARIAGPCLQRVRALAGELHADAKASSSICCIGRAHSLAVQVQLDTGPWLGSAGHADIRGGDRGSRCRTRDGGSTGSLQAQREGRVDGGDATLRVPRNRLQCVAAVAQALKPQKTARDGRIRFGAGFRWIPKALQQYLRAVDLRFQLTDTAHAVRAQHKLARSLNQSARGQRLPVEGNGQIRAARSSRVAREVGLVGHAGADSTALARRVRSIVARACGVPPPVLGGLHD